MKQPNCRRGVALMSIGVALLIAAGGWLAINLAEDSRAGKQASQLLDRVLEEQASPSKDTNAPLITVDGEIFCGTVIIDKLEVQLPIYQEWSYPRLKKAPCRYVGSIEGDDLIIAAHNYKSHFGDLRQLQEGDEVCIADARGTLYRYAVRQIVALDGTAVTDMQAGMWDLTLFTCTKSGKQRVTVRCERQ